MTYVLVLVLSLNGQVESVPLRQDLPPIECVVRAVTMDLPAWAKLVCQPEVRA